MKNGQAMLVTSLPRHPPFEEVDAMRILRFPVFSFPRLIVKYTTSNGAIHCTPPVRGGWEEAEKLRQALLKTDGVIAACVADKKTLARWKCPSRFTQNSLCG